MTRLGWLIGALVGALLIAVLASQAPRPRGTDAAATAFSAARAMADVREIARAPHPIGTPEHGRVRDYIIARMAALGLSPQTQVASLGARSQTRLDRWDIGVGSPPVTNIVGVLPGRDRSQPAVLIMAHYDTVPDSPGAADDTAGVASILEAVRAIKARGVAQRDLIVLITDAEELGLDGARAFFTSHPLRARVGQVVNLEARGGGGRAMMFETGRGAAGTVDLWAKAGPRADGGTTANALAVFVYELMPNGTDFTIPKDEGIGGLNFAFIGRPSQYHDPSATPDALDQGALQSLGSQALEAADALLRADALPGRGPDRAFGDLFGRAVIAHPPAVGWLLLALGVGGVGIIGWRLRPSPLQALVGAAEGLWLLSAGLVVPLAVRALAGPMAERAQSAEAYYTLLRRLPWMEAGAGLTLLALALLVLGGRSAFSRPALAAVIAAAALVGTIAAGPTPLLLAPAALALVLSFAPAPRSAEAAWLGLIGLVLLLGLAAQLFAPTTSFLFLWPALLATAAGVAAALVGVHALAGRLILTLAAVIGAGWALYLAHPVFLGIGMDLPGAVAVLGLMAVMLLRPLAPEDLSKPLALAALIALLLACGVSGAAQVTEPMRSSERVT